jgi:tetratricopeptide (TPR) repeat protein
MNELPLPRERHLRPGRPVLRQVALWTLLALVFLAAYQWLAVPRGAAVSPRSALSRGLVAGGAIALFCAFFLFFFLRAQAWLRAYNRGVSFVAAGEEVQALAHFEAAARRGAGSQRALALFYLGLCRLNLGEVDRALELFGAAHRSGALSRIAFAHEALPNLVATCYGLRNEPALARPWLQEGQRRAGARPPAMALLAEALLLCREGQPGAALQLMDARWTEAEAAGGRYTRRVRLLRAFALDALDPAANAPAVFEALAAVKPVRAGDFEPLAASWPELETFVERAGLHPASTAIV